MLALSECWTSKFQRSEYGLSMSGLRNETACPAKVPRPADEPDALEMPVGNGLLIRTVPACSGLSRLVLGAAAEVDWLKPSWLINGLVE